MKTKYFSNRPGPTPGCQLPRPNCPVETLKEQTNPSLATKRKRTEALEQGKTLIFIKNGFRKLQMINVHLKNVDCELLTLFKFKLYKVDSMWYFNFNYICSHWQYFCHTPSKDRGTFEYTSVTRTISVYVILFINSYWYTYV